ncbi:TnsA-like heteromeric transposase endonuclease subunit [Streptomyces minutiscleroticus]|nr:TnsA-like heteromeric transposase endonuclease subunit [Streptomyces minutiscleroticus]
MHPSSTTSAAPAEAATDVAVPEAAAVQAVFTAPDGSRIQRRWCEAAVSARLEDIPPVAPFPTVPGRRWGPGWWWSSTTGRHVTHGSQAMRTQLMFLDCDPQVVALAARPVRLLWRDPEDGRVRTWVPQVFARYADGHGMLADCPHVPGAGGRRAQRAAAILEAACAAVGFVYRRLAVPEAVWRPTPPGWPATATPATATPAAFSRPSFRRSPPPGRSWPAPRPPARS